MKKVTSYSDFWIYYLSEHSQRSTRIWHYIGTAFAIIMLILLLVSANWVFLPLIFISGYGFAWMSHALIEKNKPATFTYPFWSLISDFKMFFYAITGRLDKELSKAAINLAHHNRIAQ